MTHGPSVEARAAWVHQRLLRFEDRLYAGIARPGECSVIFDTGGYAQHSGGWFMRMARQAVRRKYMLAGEPAVVALLDRIDAPPDPTDTQRLASLNGDHARIRRALFQGTVRLAQHATRWRCADVDLFACTGCPLDLTAWLFQQSDLRYRLHDSTRSRLRFMIDCWAHYGVHGFNDETAWFGLEAFPTGPQLWRIQAERPAP